MSIEQVLITLGLSGLFFIVHFLYKNHSPSVFHAKISGALYDLGVNIISLPADLNKVVSEKNIQRFNEDKKANPKEQALRILLAIFDAYGAEPSPLFWTKSPKQNALLVIDEWVQQGRVNIEYGLEVQLKMLRTEISTDDAAALHFTMNVEIYVRERLAPEVISAIEEDEEFEKLMFSFYKAAYKGALSVEETGELCIKYFELYAGDRDFTLQQIAQMTENMNSLIR